jgi:trimeric autotransporter adhesin
MRKQLLLFTALLSTLFFYQCTLNRNQREGAATVVANTYDNNTAEKEDGIREAQEMEFEKTKDIALGYVPKERLINAYENMMQMRKNGATTSPGTTAGTAALTWAERGPNTDIIGSSNGNTRGTQVAADGVTSGRMRAIWVDLADVTNRTVWAGGISGGLWKTNDITSTSAAAWSLVNDFFGNLSISSITQDPTNTTVMYFGTGEKTFNQGAVRGGGIWKSTNSGVTWALLPSTASFNSISKILCDVAGNVYVTSMGLFGANGVLRSTDGGTSWTTITPTGLTAFATEMKLSSTGRLHVVCGYRLQGGTSGYRFTDNPSTVTSASWISPTTTFPTDYNTEIAVAGPILYAEPSDANYRVPLIYKSIDGGANWAVTGTSPPGGAAEPSILPGQQGWYDLAIGVDPANPNNVIAGGLNFYRSADGGGTWSQITRWVGTALNYVHADHHTVVWNGTQVLVGTDGGIFYSNNNGVSFTDRNDGLRLKQFYSCAIHPVTTNYFIAGAQDNGTHQLSNAGLSGSVEVIGGDGCFTHIDQDEPQYQFSAFPRSSYIRSTNSGASWAGVTHSTAGTYQFINPTDYDDIGNKMYLAGIAGQYVRWENPQTGSTFTPITIAAFNSSQPSTVSVSPFTANKVFFGTNGGRIVRVDNAHLTVPTETNITGSTMSASTASCVAVGTNDNNLLTTFSNYGAAHVWVSTTGGGAAGWTNVSGNLPDIPVRWAMFYPENNTKAIIATEMGIYETDLINGAATVWVLNTTFPTVRTDMLQYRKSDGTIAAATYGRGIWTSTIPFTNPYVRFAANYNTQTEGTTATTGTCRNYKDYTVNMNIDQAPTGNANITVSVAGGGTATQGVDFDFTTNGNFTVPSNALTFASGSTTPQPVTIRVYNDAEIESEEFFTLNYIIGGGTNAIAAPSSTNYIFTIPDNDVAPVVSTYNGTFAIGTANTTLTTESPFRSNSQKFRIQYLFTAAEFTAAGITSAGNINSMAINVITKNSTQPYTGFTIGMTNTSAVNLNTGFVSNALTQVYTGNYTSAVGSNLFNFTTPFAWDGTSNVVVNFCFDNAPNPADAAADVVEATAAPLGAGIRACTYSNSTVGAGCSLAAAFINDPRITATFGAAGGNPVETVLNNNRTEFVTNNGIYHFYSGQNILSRINSASANLGCVTSNVFEAGTTPWATFSAGERSLKVIEITPTTNSGASYTVGLYYTAAELAGKVPANLKIAKTTAATMAGANSGNTIVAATTATAFGTGYLFTASFTGFSKFFLVDNNVVLPVNLISFSGSLNNQYHSQLQWQTANQFNLSKIEVQRSYDGTQFTTVGTVDAYQNSNNLQDYNFTDPDIAKAVNFYRLKMIDADSKFKLSAVVKINNSKIPQFVQLLGNPVSDNISFIINNRDKENVFAELFNSTGQLVNQWNLAKADGNIVLPFNSKQPASGIYTLRITAGTKVESVRINKQ